MKNKSCSKKVTATIIIFCIIVILGIVLSLTLGVNTNQREVRTAQITFDGSIISKDVVSALENELGDGSNVTLKQVTATDESATASDNATTTDNSSETTTTSATTVASTTAAGTFDSGKMIATITGVDSKSNDEIRASFEKVFSGSDYEKNNLKIDDLYSVNSISEFSAVQVYLCIIVLLAVFVYCLIRFYANGALASALSVVIASVISAVVTVCASLICGVFVGSNISIVAGITVILTAIFSNIILEGIKRGSEGETSTVLGVSAIVLLLLVITAVVGIVCGDVSVIGYAVPGLFAVVFSAISALVYVESVWSAMSSENNKQGGKNNKNKKKAVIK